MIDTVLRLIRLLAMVAPLALAACGPAAPDPRAAPAGPPEKPSFDVTVPGMQAAIASLGDPWSKPSKVEILPDAATGGTIIATKDDRGEAGLYRLPTGWVWQVQLTAGHGKACGAVADVERALPILLARIPPGALPSPAQTARLKAGLTATTPATLDIGHLRLTAIGDCVRRLTVTAI